MLAIRLRRTGSKKRPFFRVVVTDSRTARDSSFVEVLGYYNPRTKPETLNLDRARLDHWLKAGAQPSDTVRTLVARMPAAPAAAVDQTPPPDEQRRSSEAVASAEQPAS
jgi:small subunit ribosomal protein S16